jgi:hypothetical protein
MGRSRSKGVNMAKCKQWLIAVGKWIVVGLAVALSAVLLGRRSKGINLDLKFNDLKFEETSRSVQDATNDAALKTEKTELQELPKTVSQMTDDAVNDELKKRGLE